MMVVRQRRNRIGSDDVSEASGTSGGIRIHPAVLVLVLRSQPCELRLTVGQIRNRLLLTACYMWITARHDVSTYRVF